jgi:hypothetical protein
VLTVLALVVFFRFADWAQDVSKELKGKKERNRFKNKGGDSSRSKIGFNLEKHGK